MLGESLARQPAPAGAAPTGVTERATVAAPAGTLAGPSRTASAASSFGYGATVDKKKSDDNGGGTVPAGPKQFNPTVPNTDTSGFPFSLATVEKPQKPEWDNGADEQMASRLGALRHQSVAELGINLSAIPGNTLLRYRR